MVSVSESTAEAEQAGWREAIDVRDWERAYELLREADGRNELDATALEQLAETSRWTRRYGEMLEGLERAAEAFEREGSPVEAGRVSVKLSIEYYQRNEIALAGGCLHRAAGLLTEGDDSNASGMLLYCWAFQQREAGEPEAAEKTAIEMIEMAQRLGDSNLEALGLTVRGRARQLAGGFSEGAALLDRAAAGAIAGGLDLWTSGVVLCANISASRHRGDFSSASEWSDAANRWCERNSVGYFPGLCRLHKAETLSLRGQYEEAVAEIEPAIEDLMAAMPRWAADGLQEFGETRRRQGNLEAAAELFARSIELGGDALPGLLLLRLDEGKPAQALALARDRLANPRDTRLAAGRPQILPPAIQAAVEAGQLEYAHELEAELDQLARACNTPALNAAHATAAGRIACAEGDHAEATKQLRAACGLWSEVGARYDCALARVELARVELAAGDRAAAEVEIERATAIFRQIGAEFELERAGASLEEPEQGARRVTTTMLFTDIVGSTELVEALGDEAWEALLAWHDRALRSCLSESGGREVKHEGDGLFAAFDDPDSAIGCACEIQRKLRRHQAEHGFAPSIRIGVHSDEVNDRGGDFGGHGVHLAARVMAGAGAGEVLVTRATLEQTSGSFAARDERELDAKGIADAVPVACLDWAETA